MRLTTHNESFDLLPDRAIYWPRRSTLLVADLHLGKPNVFRVAGIPVPDACPADLARLSSLIATHAPERLVILGDLLHARAAHSPQLLEALHTWRAAHTNLDILLIRGNHDTHAGDPPASLRFRIENEPFADAHDALIAFSHFPPTPAGHTQDHGPLPPPPRGRGQGVGKPSAHNHITTADTNTPRANDSPSADTLTLCGHLHPAVRLRGPVSSLRADCFYLTPAALVLPAFGAFTGSKVITPRTHDRVFVVGDREVIECPRAERCIRRQAAPCALSNRGDNR